MRSVWGDRGGGGWLPFHMGSVPVVRVLLVASAVVFLLYFLPATRGLALLLGFSVFGPSGRDWLVQPWAMLTYPLLVKDPISLLIQGLWLYMVGGSLERSWGARPFAALFFIFTALAAVAFVPAGYLFRADVGLAGLTLPLSALTVAWAALDPELEIYFWGVLPLKLKMLALVDVLLTYFYFGFTYGPLVAVFTLAGPAAAWYYVRKLPRLTFAGPARRPRTRFRELLRDEPPPRERVPRPNPLRRRQEQAEQERLRKLLGEDDDGPRVH